LIRRSLSLSALSAITNIAHIGVRQFGAAVYASVGIFDKIFAQTIIVDDLTAPNDNCSAKTLW